ncbi:MAG: hypothetical protein SPL70_03400 [Cyanobacteriota bacterium]|nr:hypothetical protein [Cyanobacteriota bacterium]
MAMEELIAVSKENLSEAEFMCGSYVDKIVRNRIFLNVLGAEVFSQYLNNNGVNTEDIHYIHSIKRVVEHTDIADIILPNIHIDVRVVFDKDKIFIPKEHFDLGIVPDVYIVLKYDKSNDHTDFLGYFEPKIIDFKNTNGKYYFVSPDDLSSTLSIIDFITDFKGNTNKDLTDSEILRGRELSVSLADHDITDDEYKEFLNLLVKSDSLRNSVLEYDNFETLAYHVAKIFNNDIKQAEEKQKDGGIVNIDDFMNLSDESSTVEPEIVEEPPKQDYNGDDMLDDGMGVLDAGAGMAAGAIGGAAAGAITGAAGAGAIASGAATNEAIELAAQSGEIVAGAAGDLLDGLYDNLTDSSNNNNENKNQDELPDVSDDLLSNDNEVSDMDEMSFDDVNLDDFLSDENETTDSSTDAVQDFEISQEPSDIVEEPVTEQKTAEPEKDSQDETSQIQQDEIKDIQTTDEPEIGESETLVDNSENIESEENKNDAPVDLSDISTDETDLGDLDLSLDSDLANQDFTGDMLNLDDVSQDMNIENTGDEIQNETQDETSDNELTGGISDLPQDMDISLNDEVQDVDGDNVTVENLNLEQNTQSENETETETPEVGMTSDATQSPEDEVSVASTSDVTDISSEDGSEEDADYDLVDFSDLAAMPPEKDENLSENVEDDDKIEDFSDFETVDAEELMKATDNPDEEPVAVQDTDENGVKENSTVISDKTFKVGEIPIDINKKSDDEADAGDGINGLYNDNDELVQDSGLNNDVRVVRKDSKPIPLGVGIAGVALVVMITGAILFSVSKMNSQDNQPISEDNEYNQNNPAAQDPNAMNIDNNNVVMNDNNNNMNTAQPPALQANTAAPTRSAKQIAATSFLSIKKLSWEVPDYISYNSNFRQYFQSTGKSLKSALSSDLLLATDYVYSDQIKVSIVFDRDGTFKQSRILLSSGSSQVDNIVLQSVNQTLKVLKAPNSVGNDESTTVILKIYL